MSDTKDEGPTLAGFICFTLYLLLFATFITGLVVGVRALDRERWLWQNERYHVESEY